MEQHEEFEHVPWSELAAGMEQRRGRVAYVLAGVILAVAIGAVVARAAWPRGAAGETVATAVPAASVETTSGAPAPTQTVPAPALYSEADLRAAAGGDMARIAAARAEWFVADFFTADLDPGGSLDVRKALPAGATLADLPHDAPAAGISYVEWARAAAVEELATGLYGVDVAFRAIGGPVDGPLVRMPVRAVRVVVEGDGFGMAVVDLPAPIPLPVETSAQPWPEGAGEVPAAIAAAALDIAAGWGSDAVVTGGSAAGAGWRVVMEVTDPAGNGWPLAVWLDELGRLALPPWRTP